MSKVPSLYAGSKVAKRSALPASRRDHVNRQAALAVAAQNHLKEENATKQESLARQPSGSSSASREARREQASRETPPARQEQLTTDPYRDLNEHQCEAQAQSRSQDQDVRHEPRSSPAAAAASSSSSSSSSPSSFSRPPASEPATTLRTAGEVARALFGDHLKTNSMNAMCRKLAASPARREATQRRAGQRLNLERRSNVEALLAHMAGAAAPLPCKNCLKGHGPWTQCVVYGGAMCGSCTNCWFNASGSRCSFHAKFAPASADAPHSQQTPPRGPGPRSRTKPLPASASASASTSARRIPPRPPSSLAASLHRGGGISILDGAMRLVQKAVRDAAVYSRRDRLLARIEAAAEELAMRVAEYEEYMGTPEGMAEESAAMDTVGRAIDDDDGDDDDGEATDH